MKSIFAVVLFAIAAAGSVQAAESLTIVAKSEDGSIIKTDDGSIFEVDSFDRFDSNLWTSGDDVVLTDDEDQLFNPGDESSITVKRVR